MTTKEESTPGGSETRKPTKPLYAKPQLYAHCPKCGREYDEIDADYLICSKCGWDAEDGEYKPASINELSEADRKAMSDFLIAKYPDESQYKLLHGGMVGAEWGIRYARIEPGPEWVASNILDGAAKRIAELEAEVARLQGYIKVSDTIGREMKWFTFDMFHNELMQFAMAYHKPTNKDISNDASEWAYQIFTKPPDKVKHVTYCEQCDGCGWYEGGPTLKTTCQYCNGTGIRK